MKKIATFFALASLAAVALAQSATAATITVNQTLDLTQPKTLPGPGFQGWQSPPAFNGGFNVAIAEGDTFDFTIDFLGSQTLTLANASALWAFSYADVGSDVTGTGTLALLDAAGNAFLTSNSFTSTEGFVHFGQYFNSGEFAGGLPASITFSGLRYVGTVDDYIDAGVTTKNYDNPGFYFVADRMAVGGAVPEPASWALMIAGFGLVGSAMRRRVAKVTYA
jgi:hypothetical protein